jgi:MoaA/NifB/PqqE/SkfB family radical SAM enzyme
VKKSIGIIIPALNEASRIEPTLREMHAHFAALGAPFSILVVDDGSTDETVAVVQRLARQMPEISVRSHARNQGKGAAVRTGMLMSQGDVLFMCDADSALKPDQFARLLDPIVAGEVAVTIGSRYSIGSEVQVVQPYWRRLWSRLAHKLTGGLFAPGIRDLHCGYKAFSASAAQAVFSKSRISGWAFDLEVLHRCQRLGYAIREVPVRWRDDGRSKVNPLTDLIRVLREAPSLYRVRLSERRQVSLAERVSGASDSLVVGLKLLSRARDTRRPFLVHLCVSRRCNLDCGYCYEYDNSSQAIGLDELKDRVRHIHRLGALLVNLNGGEPLLNQDILELIRYIRSLGMVPVMNSNGYLLTREKIEQLGKAGLYAYQISVDAMRPSRMTKKAWVPLREKLVMLSKHARFRVRINSVLGSGYGAVDVARAAMRLGFDAKCSFMRSEHGSLIPLSSEVRETFDAIQALGKRSPWALREDFMKDLARDGFRDWKCRSGARYFWVCEQGLVHLCESSFGSPGIPIAQYTARHIQSAFDQYKTCSRTCAVAYAHQGSRLDAFRPQRDRSKKVAKRSWREQMIRPAAPSVGLRRSEKEPQPIQEGPLSS